jgi:site-specific DNA recombinase
VIKADLRRQIETFRVEQVELRDRGAENRVLLLQVFGDRSYWMTLLNEEKRDIYRALVDRVLIREGVVEEIILKV